MCSPLADRISASRGPIPFTNCTGVEGSSIREMVAAEDLAFSTQHSPISLHAVLGTLELTDDRADFLRRKTHGVGAEC